eukprot:EG_transcript_4573
MPVQPAGKEGPSAFRVIQSPRRRWVGSGLNRRLVACRDSDSDDSSPERPARPPTLPVQTGTRSPVALWDDVQVRPPAKLQPKAHGALYRRPGPETHPAAASGPAADLVVRRSRSAGSQLSSLRRFDRAPDLNRTAPSPHAVSPAIWHALNGKPHTEGGWRVRKTSPPPREAPAPPPPRREYSTDELSSLPSSNRFLLRRQRESGQGLREAPPPYVPPSRQPRPPSSVASSRRDPPTAQRPPSGPSPSASSQRVRRTWGAGEDPPLSPPTKPLSSNASTGRRRWNTTWTQELEDRLAHRREPDSPDASLVRRVPVTTQAQLVRRLPPAELPAPPRPAPSPKLPTRDITPFDSASMVSYDRRSHRSGRSEGHLVKYVPIADVVPKQSAASLSSLRRRDYLSPPVPDQFAWTNEKARTLVQETKQAKGVVIRSRSPIRDKNDVEGTNFCDVCGAEYLRSQSQFCSECGSERVAVLWMAGSC